MSAAAAAALPSAIAPAHAPREVGKWTVAVSIALGSVMATIDTSIVNVAMPQIRGELGASLQEITWVTTGYMIAITRFQYCHGFAFISDLGAQRLAEGYLAIQLDQHAADRGASKHVQGEEALRTLGAHRLNEPASPSGSFPAVSRVSPHTAHRTPTRQLLAPNYPRDIHRSAPLRRCPVRRRQ